MLAGSPAKASAAGHEMSRAQSQDLLYRTLVQPVAAAGSQTAVAETSSTQGAFPTPGTRADLVIQAIGGLSALAVAASSPAGRNDPQRIQAAAGEFEALRTGRSLKSMREAGSSGWLGTGEDKALDSLIEIAGRQLARLMAAQAGLGAAHLVSQRLSEPPSKRATEKLRAADKVCRRTKQAMRIGGFRIQVAGAPAHRVEATLLLPLPGARGTGSADATHLAWFLLDAEPEPAVAAALEASIMDGSYWIPAPVVSKSLVDDHVFARP